MKLINLTQGKFALVDDEDFDRLNQHKWYYSHGYAMRDTGLGRVYMHRELTRPPKHLITDHINRNKLDNRKSNLRAVNRSANQINRGLQSNNTSGFRGVGWWAARQKWYVQLKRLGVNHRLGYFDNLDEAIGARLTAEEMYQ